MWALTFDTASMKVTNTLKVDNGIFSGFKIRNHVMSMFGKDGALYILNYDGYYDQAVNPGAMRVTYKGSCKVPVSAAPRPPEPYQKIWVTAQGIEVGEPGPHAIALYDLTGHRVWRARGGQGAEYRFADIRTAAGLKSGLYEARVTTKTGAFTRRVSLL
jgi:hypothetical protein